MEWRHSIGHFGKGLEIDSPSACKNQICKTDQLACISSEIQSCSTVIIKPAAMSDCLQPHTCYTLFMQQSSLSARLSSFLHKGSIPHFIPVFPPSLYLPPPSLLLHLLLVFQDRVFPLCSPRCPGSSSIDRAGPELKDPSAAATTTRHFLSYFIQF